MSTLRVNNLANAAGTGVPSEPNAPAFSAYLSSNQSISSSTWTKIQLANEDFDTASCYDHVTNYRFTPNIAGYYQINGKISTEGSSGTITRVMCALWVNGAENKLGGDVWEGNVTNTGCQANALLYMNGTTDYVELYAYVSAGTTRIIRGVSAATWFNGILVGAA